MKKIVAMLCVFCMVMATPVMAVDAGATNGMITQLSVSRVHPVMDASDGMNENESGDIDLLAINVPTTYAPASWYNVNHYWTAKNYTWSSYIFNCGDGYYFDCYAKQPFSVAFYYADGTPMTTYSAKWDGDNYVLLAEMKGVPASTGYYVKIINNDANNPINSNAYYKVW